jgi:hypothetical protein
MVYHPQGLTKVVEQGEILVTPLGPKEVNRRVELVSKLVASKEDELLARQEGWHLHPGDAVEASGGAKAIKSPQEVLEERNREVEEKAAKADTAIADAERRIAELEAQLAALAQPAGGVMLGSGATAKVR